MMPTSPALVVGRPDLVMHAAMAQPYEFRRLRVAELPLANQLYNECYPLRPENEAQWLYGENPWGDSVIWGAFAADGRLVAMRPAIPWRFTGQGGERSAYQFVDALVSRAHRGRGLFRRLMREALEWTSRRDAMVFSFPNANSLAAYRAIGELRVVHQCESRVKVLHWAHFIHNKLAPHTERSAAPHLQEPVTANDVVLRPITRFEDGWADVHEALRLQHCWLTVRHPAFLNWRYVARPGRDYTIAVLERRGRAQGYVVIAMKDEVAQLVDVFVQPDRALMAVASGLLIQFARNLGASAVCLRASERNPFSAVLGSHGVLVKPHVQAVAADSRHAQEFQQSLSHGGGPWFGPCFVMGDSDVW